MNQLKITSLLNFTGFCMVWKYSGIVTTEDRVMITLSTEIELSFYTCIFKP